MVNNVQLAFTASDFLFVASGGLMLGFAVVVQQTCFDVPTDNGWEAARDLLYREFPFTAGVANAALVFVAFFVSVPALLLPTNRGWLKACGGLAVVCALLTMGIGVQLWVLTLTMREAFDGIWRAQPPEVQSLMQVTFKCCGYDNSTSPAFVTDAACPSPASAALVQGCATPLVAFGNDFIDAIFTGVFGMVALDAVLVMAAACLLKDRKERERFRGIDEKVGFGRRF